MIGLMIGISPRPAIAQAGKAKPSGAYPHMGNLWGTKTESKDYDLWARYDLLIVDGTKEADTFCRELKKRHPGMIILGTAPLTEASAPGVYPWMKEEFYVRHANGKKISWWADRTYVGNVLRDDYQEALLNYIDSQLGGLLRQGLLDGIMFDSVSGKLSCLADDADTNMDGKPDDMAEIDVQWLEAENRFFEKLRRRFPGIQIHANDVDERHSPYVNGRFFEGGRLLDRMVHGAASPQDVILVLNNWMEHSVQPGDTIASMTHPLGWQGWRIPLQEEGSNEQHAVTTPGEVDLIKRDFARMRLGLLTTLMTDAYFEYDIGTLWYGNPTYWYAEFEAPLGKPLGPGREVLAGKPAPMLEWQAGQPTHSFILDSPSAVTEAGIEGKVTGAALKDGWRRLFATDPSKLSLAPGKTYRVEAECEMLERPAFGANFTVRSKTGTETKSADMVAYMPDLHIDLEICDRFYDLVEQAYLGLYENPGYEASGKTWRIKATFTPQKFQDYGLEWLMLGNGAIRLKSLKVWRLGDSHWERDFGGGKALLNTSPHPLTIDLGRTMRRLKDEAAPRYAIEVDDNQPGFTAGSGWTEVGEQRYNYGRTYHLSKTAGAQAYWNFTAPQTDTYTIFACVPKLKGMTDSAHYSLAGRKPSPSAVVDQRKGEDGWIELFKAPLRAGEHCRLVLESGDNGATAADAIRVESAARLDDGATIQRITLPPFDGAILLNQ